jgi:hypothetical protein
MAANPVIRMLSGSDAVRGATEYLKAVQERRDSWPYVHVYPPPNATDVLKISTIAVQASSDPIIEILSYTVNAGKIFYLQAVLFSASSSIVPGDCLFTLDRNSPIGSTNRQFMPEHGLIQVPVALGASVSRPWKLQRAREFGPLDVIRIKGLNVNLSGGVQYVCGIFGYEVPTLDAKTQR